MFPVQETFHEDKTKITVNLNYLRHILKHFLSTCNTCNAYTFTSPVTVDARDRFIEPPVCFYDCGKTFYNAVADREAVNRYVVT